MRLFCGPPFSNALSDDYDSSLTFKSKADWIELKEQHKLESLAEIELVQKKTEAGWKLSPKIIDQNNLAFQMYGIMVYYHSTSC